MFQDFLVDAGALLSGVVEPGKEASIDPQTGNIVVPDAELLFGGKYQQAGRDLLILGEDGDKFVIPDYFAAKKRPHLQAPDGAVITADIVDILAGANREQYAQTEGESGRAAIGRVELAAGMVTCTRNGAQIIVQAGDRVFKQDLVETGANSSCSISFLDGSAFSLSANCRMVLNEMVYSPGGAGNSQLMTLVGGAISFVSGQVAKTGDMKVSTPVATMGIRGTVVYAELETTVNDRGQTVQSMKAATLDHADGSRPGTVQFFNPLTNAFIGEVSTHGTIATFTSVGSTITFETRPANANELAAIVAFAAQASQAQTMGQQNPMPAPAPDANPGNGGGGSNGSSTPINLNGTNDGGTNDGGDVATDAGAVVEGADTNAPIVLSGTIGSGANTATVELGFPRSPPPPEPPPPSDGEASGPAGPVTAFATAEDVGLVLNGALLGLGSAEIASVGNASIGEVTLTPTGTIVFTPEENYSGPATFDVMLVGATEPITVTVMIEPVADLPALTVAPTTYAEGQSEPVLLSITASLGGDDTETLIIRITGFPAGTQFFRPDEPTTLVGGPDGGAWVISSPADLALLAPGGPGQLLMQLPETATGNIPLVVTATSQEGGASASITRPLSISETNVNQPGSVTISGAARENVTLAAVVSDGDGIGDVPITYQWFRGDVAIDGRDRVDLYPRRCRCRRCDRGAGELHGCRRHG